VVWLTLLSPLAALTFLMGMQRFETWMLSAVPIRAEVRPDCSSRRARLLEPATSAAPRVLVPRARAPQRT
jgi:hypothetical protein